MNKRLRMFSFMAGGAQVMIVLLFLRGEIKTEKMPILGALGWAIAACYNVANITRKKIK